MSNINNILTEEEKEFIRSKGLDSSDFFDARGMGGPKKYHDLAKAANCQFVISSYCNNGHRLKTRSGHCIICRTANITFQKRYSISGTIYIAVSGKYCKVGVIDNKRNTSKVVGHREYQINSEGGYGGRTEWEMIKSWNVHRFLGKIEEEVHSLLKKYKVTDKLYWYSNELREADELYECSIQEAVNAITRVLKHYN